MTITSSDRQRISASIRLAGELYEVHPNNDLFEDEDALPGQGGCVPVDVLRPGNRLAPETSGSKLHFGYEEERFRSTGRRTAPKYGLTEDAFWALVESQGTACAICTAEFTPSGPTMAIDHNHDTGEVRGVLCSTCNYALGVFQDSPDRLRAALVYLAEHGCYGPDTGAPQ